MPPPSSVDIDPGQLYRENNGMGFQYSRSRRTLIKFLIFAIVFVLSSVVGLTYTYMRPPIYESSATLLLSPDLPGSAADMNGGAAIQDVAVQSQVLLSRDLLSQVLEKLPENNSSMGAIPENLSALENMVRVTQVENSTIVNLRAEGPEKELLPIIVNTWLDLYLQKNSQMQTLKSDTAWESLQQKIAELDSRIAEKKEELNKFSEQYDIVSMQRDENQVLSQLKGLNTTLNKAVENKVSAEANLAAIKAAIAEGKWAGSFRKPNELAALENQADTLREVVTEYQQRYTPKYLQLDKDARAVIEKLARLEDKIQLKYEENSTSAIEEAEQEIASTEYAVVDINKKLSAGKKKAAMFSQRFSEYESLQEDIAQLETFSRNMKEELVAMEIKSASDIIQVKVLERAYTPERPIRPNYLRDAGLSIGLAILLGILSVLCFELFTRPAGGWPEGVAQTITYNQLIPQTHPLLQAFSGNRPDHVPIPALEQKMPRELAITEVQKLMDASGVHVQLLTAAVLNGLSLKEIAVLKWGDINRESKNIHVPGENSRIIVPTELFMRLLEQNMPGKPDAGMPVLRDKQGNALTEEELESLLIRTANDAGLDRPSEITSQALRHTYISFLVRQGGRLREITQVTGPFPNAYQAAYTMISPPGPDIPLDEMELAYPLRNPLTPV